MADYSGNVDQFGHRWNTQYGSIPGYSDLFNQRVQQLQGAHSDSDGLRQITLNQMDSAGSQFESDFSNKYGRAPTQDELSSFYKDVGTKALGDSQSFLGNTSNLGNLINQHLLKNVPADAPPSTTPGLPSNVLSDTNRTTIETEGQRQDQQSKDFIASDQAARQAQQQQLADVLTQQAKGSFQAMLPDIAENAQAAHLYDSTGYGQEVARQQSLLEQAVGTQVGLAGLGNIDLASQQKAQALQSQQGFQDQGLSRQFNLQDYMNQANLAKQIGASSVPQIGNGKGAGTMISGAGAGAAAGTSFGPYGALIGAGLGAVAGGAGQKKGK